MNIHEYQAKALFEKFGVAVPKGAAAKTPEDFVSALASLPEGPTMVKSQIHAGGRGKGVFTDGYKGGVKFCKTKAEAREVAGRMLGNTLVTAQTGPAEEAVALSNVAASIPVTARAKSCAWSSLAAGRARWKSSCASA